MGRELTGSGWSRPFLFPPPFTGITHAATITVSAMAAEVIANILAEQDEGHFHNFAVEVDHPDGIKIYGSELLMQCIKKNNSV